jgi:hypothetical protein
MEEQSELRISDVTEENDLKSAKQSLSNNVAHVKFFPLQEIFSQIH